MYAIGSSLVHVCLFVVSFTVEKPNITEALYQEAMTNDPINKS